MSSNTPSQTGAPTFGQPADPSISSFSVSSVPASLASSSTSDGGSQASQNQSRFSLPPPDFNLGKAKSDLARKRTSQAAMGSLGAAGDSIEDEIAAQITQLENIAQAPLSEAGKKKVADTIRGIRQGGWIEALKPALAGKNSVGIEYWNRLVAEHEGVIAKVAQRNVEANRKLSKQEDEMAKLRRANQEVSDLDALNVVQARRIQQLEDEVKKFQDQGSEIKRLTDELQQRDQSVKDTTSDASTLRKELADVKADLETCRKTASKHFNENAALRQQKSDGLGREQALKGQIIKLQVVEKESIAAKKREESAVKRVSTLVAELAALKQKSKQDPKNDDDFRALRNKVSTLEAQLDSERNASSTRIQALEADLRKAKLGQNASGSASGSASAGSQGTPGAQNGLEAVCADLRAARDMYRDRWARGVAANGANSRADLIEFWEAVDATNLEINQLYQSVQTLSRALGMPGPYVDRPETLDQIVQEVTGPDADQGRSLSFTVMNLRCAVSRSRLQVEEVQKQLDRARVDSTPDQIKTQLEKVAIDEVEKQVGTRTQGYRQFRRVFLDHIFQAQGEFMTLAENGSDRAGLEALVTQFLDPTMLPQPTPGLMQSGGP